MKNVLAGASSGILLLGLCAAFFAPPVDTKAEPVVIIGIIGVGIGIIDYNSCDINIIWGCDSLPPSGGGGANPSRGPVACTSAPNGCGMTNPGTDSGNGCDAQPPPDSACPVCTSSANRCGMTAGGYLVGGSCNASTPPDTSCPACSSAPNECGQSTTGFRFTDGCSASTPSNASCPPPGITPGQSWYASRTTAGPGMDATLYWSVTNATACTITSDNPAFATVTGGKTGSTGTGVLTQTSTYTLTCQNGSGGPTGARGLRIIYDPNYKEI